MKNAYLIFGIIDLIGSVSIGIYMDSYPDTENIQYAIASAWICFLLGILFLIKAKNTDE